MNRVECRERVLAALNLEKPDRVPTHALAVYNADEILNKPRRSTFDVIDQLIENNPNNWLDVLNKVVDGYEKSIFGTMAEAAIELGLDTIQCGILPYKFINKEELSDIYGRIWKMVDIGHGRLDPYFMHGTIGSVEKWEVVKQKFEDEYTKQYTRKAKKLYRGVNMKYKNKILITVETVFTGIFESAWEGMNTTFFFKQLHKNPKFVKDVYDTYANFNIAMFNAYMDAGAEVFCEAGDLAFKTGPFYNPKLYEELLQPAYKKLTDAVHDRGGKIFLHTDGQITSLLDFIINSGFDGLQGLEPTAGMDIGAVRKKVGNKLCLLGNIDVSHVLTKDGTKQDVFDAVKNAIKSAGQDGSLIISPANMHHEVLPQQLRWMVEATHKYGTYPLNL